MSNDLTRPLAEYLIDFGSNDLTDEDRHQLEILVIDHLACAAGGAYLPWGRNLAAWAAPYEGSGKARLIGDGTALSAPIAAFVNATAGHGMELDDTHDPSLTHPGAAVVATAFAVGAETGAAADDMLAAMAMGYEATARAGMATGHSILERGFHPTALFGGFGAATTAAKLYGLDARGLEAAWGLLLSMIGGSCQFSQDPEGTVVKRLHGGFGAKNGIMAAQFAKHQISGPARALDGTYGLINLFGEEDRLPAKLNPNDGAALAIHRISLKPYPCCRLFHSTIDALRDIVGELPLASHDHIKAIRVGGPNVVPTQHMERRPTSMMSAQYSLPYVMAAVIDQGAYDAAVYEEANLNEPRRHAIVDKVEGFADAEIQDAFPDHFGSSVEVEFSDGRTEKIVRLDSLGTPTFPMPLDDVIGKADGLFAGTPIAVSGNGLAELVKDMIAGKQGAESLMAALSASSK